MTTIVSTPITSLQSLRDRYAAIPDALWCIEILGNAQGQRCALGHLMEDTGGLTPEGYAIMHWTRDARRAYELFEPLRASLPVVVTGVMLDNSGNRSSIHRDNAAVLAVVANGFHPLYQQDTPKLRILTAIDDLMAMGGQEVSS